MFKTNGTMIFFSKPSVAVDYPVLYSLKGSQINKSGREKDCVLV